MICARFREATQPDAADRWGVDRSTVVNVTKGAKHRALAASRPGRRRDVDGRKADPRKARPEIIRLTEAIKQQAVDLALLRGERRGGGQLPFTWRATPSRRRE